VLTYTSSRVPYIKSVLLHRNKVEKILEKHLRERLENNVSNGVRIYPEEDEDRLLTNN
jgi:hypothetical protein